MERAFEFVRAFKSSFFEMFGYPFIEFYSDYCEVVFKTTNVIRSFKIFESFESDEFRLYADKDGYLFVVFTFYIESWK